MVGGNAQAWGRGPWRRLHHCTVGACLRHGVDHRAGTPGGSGSTRRWFAASTPGARQARTVAPAQAVEPDPVAHAPSTPASESAPPLHWGPEDLRRAAQDDGAQERRWGRIVPHQRWTAETAHNGQVGDNVRLSEQHAVGGGRVTRVQRGGAVYCVEIPSTNQPPAMGAAPRMAMPRTCS